MVMAVQNLKDFVSPPCTKEINVEQLLPWSVVVASIQYSICKLNLFVQLENTIAWHKDIRK